MPRTVILDGNVVDQINRGNTAAATALRNLIKSGATVYISQQAYNEMIKNSELPRTRVANELLLNDLNIKVAPPGNMAARVDAYAANPKLSDADLLVVAQAKGVNAELWSFDRAFRKNHAQISSQLNVKIASETINIAILEGKLPPQDYRVARRILRLPPVDISFSGAINRPGPKGSLPGLSGPPPSSAAPASPAGGPPPTTAARGAAPRPIDMSGVNSIARGQAIGGGIQLGLRILNSVLNTIAEDIQKKRADQALKAELPNIERMLQDPTKGVLIRFNFSQIMPHGDSAINPGPVFESISLANGSTRDEALRNFPPTLSRDAPRTNFFSKDVWIEPAEKPKVNALRLPFPRQARARFADGKARLQGVEWGGITGFDDESELPTLLLPTSKTIEFFVLKPSSIIRWFNGSIQIETHIPLVSKNSANGVALDVVDLDPSLWWNVTAAMVFPANDDTDELIKPIGKTRDNLNQLGVLQNFGRVRWIRPENLHVIEKY